MCGLSFCDSDELRSVLLWFWRNIIPLWCWFVSFRFCIFADLRYCYYRKIHICAFAICYCLVCSCIVYKIRFEELRFCASTVEINTIPIKYCSVKLLVWKCIFWWITDLRVYILVICVFPRICISIWSQDFLTIQFLSMIHNITYIV